MTSQNSQPCLTEHIDKDGIIFYRMPEYISKHKYLYQIYHNCKVDRKHVVIFLNGNRRDFSVDNLCCITRGELAVLNKIGGISSNREETLNNLLLVRIKMKRVELAKEIGLTDNSGHIVSDKSEAQHRYYMKNREKEIKRVTEWKSNQDRNA